MRPARILHLIDSLDLGGAQEVVVNIVRGADRSRFGHEVATLHGQGIYFRRLMEAGVRVHSLSPAKWLPAYIPGLASLLSGSRFDILHCHLIASNVIGKPLGRIMGVPVIINHDHTNDPSRGTNPLILGLETWANRLAAHTIAVSASCRDFLVRREGVANDRVSIIHNAIDTTRFTPSAAHRAAARSRLKIPAEGPVVAGVGRLNPQKNFSLFIEIAGLVAARNGDTRFLIAGTGPEEALLRSKASALGLDGRITFAGYVADPRDIYNSCDVLLMPSRFEGLPMTLLEAMAMEVPVVASRLDGIAEVVTDNRDGFLIRPDDAAAFASTVTALIGDPERRRSVGIAARRKVEEGFSAQRMVSEIEAIYDRFLP
jgi:glycosyltransferase involved in cell wall biosynthesis